MTQRELDRAVAHATGETLAEIRHLGFGPADLRVPRHDPEPARRPLVFDWDRRQPAPWPAC